jgi:hypothetical protein
MTHFYKKVVALFLSVFALLQIISAQMPVTKLNDGGRLSNSISLGGAQSEGARFVIAPLITSLSATTLSKSGRLKIKGRNFGVRQQPGVVKIGGVQAPVSSWSDTSITAYIPEAVLTGSIYVETITSAGPSNTKAINVTPRQPSGNVKWRFQADDAYIQGRPGIGPDSTIYALGINGHLYALTPDGGLKWIFTVLSGSTQSVSVGNDGAIYFAGLNTVYAVNPDGSLKWSVADPSGASVDVGPTVGPDGNIYAVTHSAGRGLGAMAISPAGQILWNRPEFLHANGTAFFTKEVVFSAGQLYFCMNSVSGNSGLQALKLNGKQVWTRSGEYQPSVAPDGRIYVISAMLVNSYAEISSYDPQGNLIRKFFGNETRSLTVPDVGPDGVFYTSRNYSTLVATDPDGTTKWSVAGKGFLGGPVVSPGNKQVVVGGYEIGKPGYVAGVSTNGKLKWQVSLPKENGGYVRPQSRPKFSLDGAVVYVGMDVNDYANDVYTYLYAFNTGTSLPELNKSTGHRTNYISDDAVSDELFKIFPNPATDHVIVRFSCLAESSYNLAIQDMQGKIVLSKNGKTAKGLNSLTLNLNTLGKGVYILQVSVDQLKIFTQKLMRQ